MRKKKERWKDEEKIYEHLSDFGTALSGLWADRGDCRFRWNKIFYCMDWHCSDPLCAGLLHMGIWDRIPQIVRWIFGILCGIFFLSFLVIEGMVIRQMHAQGEDNLDYVIVLGAQVHADKPSVVLKYRLDEAILYLNENPETVCIVAGGQGKNEPYSEAYGMAQYLMQNGIDKERILLEDQSKTTEENLRYSRKFLPEDAEVGIITNDFHMFRALQIAQKQGLSDVCGIAADSTKFYLPNNMLREYCAEIKFLIRSVK